MRTDSAGRRRTVVAAVCAVELTLLWILTAFSVAVGVLGLMLARSGMADEGADCAHTSCHDGDLALLVWVVAITAITTTVTVAAIRMPEWRLRWLTAGCAIVVGLVTAVAYAA